MSESNDIQLDYLSATGRRLLRFETADAYEKLVIRGNGNLDARAVLDSVRAEDLINGEVKHPEAAQSALAGLWIWHGWIDLAHPIVQEMHTPIGSAWHAIVHRLEGDFSNSQYWYRRAGELPIDAAIASNVARVTDQMPVNKALFALTVRGWNPTAFVDLVEEAHTKPADDPHYRTCVQIQQIEWRLLFDHCVRSAI